MKNDTGLSTKERLNASLKRQRNKKIGIIVGLILIATLSIYVLKNRKEYSVTPLTAYNPTKEISECYNSGINADDLIQCLNEKSPEFKEKKDKIKQLTARTITGLMEIEGESTRSDNIIKFKLKNKSPFDFDMIKIKITAKNYNKDIMWENSYTLKNINLKSKEATTISTQVNESPTLYDWKITYIK